jgi:hypothetical protein
VKCSLAQRIQKAPSSNISNLKCIKQQPRALSNLVKWWKEESRSQRAQLWSRVAALLFYVWWNKTAAQLKYLPLSLSGRCPFAAAAAQREKWRCRNLQPMKFHPAPASPAFQPARDQGGYLISKTVARALTRALLNQEKRLRKRDGQSFSTTWCASEPSESGRPAARFCDNPLCADRSDQVTRLIYSTARSCG